MGESRSRTRTSSSGHYLHQTPLPSALEEFRADPGLEPLFDGIAPGDHHHPFSSTTGHSTEEFDAREFIREHLKKGNQASLRTSFAADEGGEDSVAESLLRKTGKLQRVVDSEIQRIVVSHQDDLLAEANKAAKLQSTVNEVNDDAQELRQDIERIKTQISTPYEELQGKSKSLRRVLQCTAVLRKTLALQQVTKRLLSQVSSPQSMKKATGATLESEKVQEQINTWLGRDLVRAVPSLREAEDLLMDISLSRVEAVEEQRPIVKRVGRLIRTRLSQVAQESAQSLNQAELGAAMQAAHDLGDLPEVVEHILENCADSLFTSTLAIFHCAAIDRKDGENFSIEELHRRNEDVATEPTDQQRDIWYERIWKQAERFSQKLFRVSVQIWSLQRVLGRKRDPYSQKSLLHHLLNSLKRRRRKGNKSLRVLHPLVENALSSRSIHAALKLSVFECFWQYTLISVKDVFDVAAGEVLQDSDRLSIHLREFQEQYKSKYIHRIVVRETPKLRWYIRSSLDRVYTSTARVSLRSTPNPSREAQEDELMNFLANEWAAEGVGGHRHQREMLRCVQSFTDKFVSSLGRNLKAAVQYSFQEIRFPPTTEEAKTPNVPSVLQMDKLRQWFEEGSADTKLVELSKQWEVEASSWLQQRNCDVSTDPLWAALCVGTPNQHMEDPGIVSHESISRLCQKISEYLLLCQNDQSLLAISAESVLMAVQSFVSKIDQLTREHRYAISAEHLWNPGISRQYCGDWLERLQYFLSSLEQCIRTVERRLEALRDSAAAEECFDLAAGLLSPCENSISRLIRMILYPQAIGISGLLIQRLRPLFSKQNQADSSQYLDQLEIDSKLLADRNLASLPTDASIREDVCNGIAKRLTYMFLQSLSLVSPMNEETRNQCVSDIAQFEKAISSLCTDNTLEHLGRSHQMLRAFKQFLLTPTEQLGVDNDAVRKLPVFLVLQGILSRAPLELNLPHEFDGVSPIVYVYWIDQVAASFWGNSVYGDRMADIGDEDLLMLQAHVQLFSREEVESRVDKIVWKRVKHCLESYFQYISANEGKSRQKCLESVWIKNNTEALLDRTMR
eukprot:gb/GECG01001767.1/.p1 GENE.gb/GECG01001767.1/~~gb/GECG01001767.1/.p1  ORF type:complete len:1075 (+),score=154.15 gb/GECG01001767.1/:1-3225(+)